MYKSMKPVLRPFLREISISEARRRLPSLLREIAADPDVGYRILRRNKPVAELCSPQLWEVRLHPEAVVKRFWAQVARRNRTMKRHRGGKGRSHVP